MNTVDSYRAKAISMFISQASRAQSTSSNTKLNRTGPTGYMGVCPSQAPITVCWWDL
ncbi:photosystem II protein D1 [Iris pallida]|uniref:Photosystem II protein D1 (Chloroplast) n=1 Tax=Iris pallida TaxID=29817 RepID=A0AAX6E1E0_IRIPA|nr:photosystem II protein D1 [Iris pallida]